jgi:radical SAM protein with 4Fe4S-binding SPASM domain
VLRENENGDSRQSWVEHVFNVRKLQVRSKWPTAKNTNGGCLDTPQILNKHQTKRRNDMFIETEDDIFETFFQHAQIEITGKCNMRCRHCRAWAEAKVHMPIDVIRTILGFAKENADPNFRLTVSGGEPFLHPSFIEIMEVVHGFGINDVIVTTNGSMVTDRSIIQLKAMSFKNLCIQVSVDSTSAEKHDTFRGFRGAFAKATDCLRRVSAAGISSSLRSTINPGNVDEVEGLIALARSCGAIRVGIGSVIPAGLGKQNTDLLMSSEQKQRFLTDLSQLKTANPDIDVTTEDPLKFALTDCSWDYGGGDINSPAFFCGCTAGVTGFNADSEGTLTPCAVLSKNILNVCGKSSAEIAEEYVNSDVIKSLITRNYSGKCGACHLKRLCGGCRAVADGISGDYLGSDTTCWLKL